jgi:transposase
MEDDEANSPMPPVGTDLSQASLTKDQRIWLAQMIISKRYSVRELADMWKMSYHKVWKFGRRMKKGRIPQDGPGRPRLVDAVSMADICANISEEEMHNTRMLGEILDAAYSNTVERRYKRALIDEFDAEFDLRMHTRSKRRYRALVQQNSHLV